MVILVFLHPPFYTMTIRNKLTKFKLHSVDQYTLAAL